MKRQEIIQAIEELKAALTAPLPGEELANGWTPKSQEATLALLHEIEEALPAKRELPSLSIGRGLDHWGVEGGPLFEMACELSNCLREVED